MAESSFIFSFEPWRPATLARKRPDSQSFQVALSEEIRVERFVRVAVVLLVFL